jgi:hypothetical protein
VRPGFRGHGGSCLDGRVSFDAVRPPNENAWNERVTEESLSFFATIARSTFKLRLDGSWVRQVLTIFVCRDSTFLAGAVREEKLADVDGIIQLE